MGRPQSQSQHAGDGTAAHGRDQGHRRAVRLRCPTEEDPFGLPFETPREGRKGPGNDEGVAAALPADTSPGSPPSTPGNGADFADQPAAEKFAEDAKVAIAGVKNQAAYNALIAEQARGYQALKRMGKWGTETAIVIEQIRAEKLHELR